MKVIDINKLTKYYNKHRGILDISFSVEEGELFGFIGPNGAGKSTTIRTLLNFIYPTSGTALVFGKDIVKETLEIRKAVGYLPPEVSYYSDMKVRELLNYSASFYDGDFSDRIDYLAGRLELDQGRKIEDLSSGNKKKVGIIQAMLHLPKLIILDEPTTGLDPLMQNVFFELLREESQKGVTIFFSSHVLGEVQKMCDRVAIIKEGKIMKVESIENLTKNQFKNVTITLEKQEDVKFEMDGIIRKEIVGRVVKFLYSGDIRNLLQKLNQISIMDLSIEEPSLEEIFIHYYEK